MVGEAKVRTSCVAMLLLVGAWTGDVSASTLQQEETIITVNVGSNAVTAAGPVGTSIGVSWWSAGGERTEVFQGSIQPRGDREGLVHVPLRVRGGSLDGEYVFADPGTHLSVDVGGTGDPVEFPVPEMYAIPDPQTDQVHGLAPPNTTAWLHIRHRTTESGVTVDIERLPVDLDSAGRFSVDLAGQLDLTSGHYGELVAELSNGHRFARRWTDARLTLEPGRGILRLFATNHERFRITLGDRTGEPYLISEGRIGHTESFNGVCCYRGQAIMGDLPTLHGGPLVIMEGDTVAVVLEGLEVEAVIPRMDAWADLQANTVRGIAPAGSTVELSVAGKDYLSTADSAGRFAIPLTSGTLRGGDWFRTYVHVGRVRIALERRVEHLFVDLDTGLLSGAWRANTSGRATWLRDGQPLASSPAKSEANAEIEPVQLIDFRSTAPQPGDVIRLEPDAVEPDIEPMELVVPAFDARVEGDPMQFMGHAENDPPNSLRTIQPSILYVDDPVFAWPMYGRDHESLVWLPDGQFRRDYAAMPEIGPPPDWWQPQVIAFLQIVNGHTLARRSSAPVLSASLGTRVMCGNGDPHASVHVERESASGERLGTWDLKVGPDGRFQVTAQQELPPITAGEHWFGTSGGVVFDWVIPRLENRMDWEAYELEVLTDSNRTVHFKLPIRTDCWGRQVTFDSAVGFVIDLVVADADGRVTVPLGRFRETAEDTLVLGIQSATYAEAGHQLTARVYPLETMAHLGTDRVDVRSASGSEVTVSSSDGSTGSAVTDGTGWGTVSLTQDNGPARVETGDRLTVGAPGQEVSLELPVLDFDFSHNTGLIGRAEPDATIEVLYTAQDGRQFRSRPVADENGNWRVPNRDVGYRGSFSLLDVEEIRAEVSVGDRHSAVRSATIRAPQVQSIWLPFALQR